MKATQHLTGGVGASLALQSITSPTAAAGTGAGSGTPANSSGQAAAASSAGGASA